MKTKTKLEEYFENYMKKQGSNVKHESFSTYIDKHYDSEAAIDEALKRAYAVNDSKKSEKLYSDGLSRSGYVGYLKQKSEKDLKKDRESLEKEYSEQLRRGSKDYQGYLKGLITQNERLGRTVANELISKEIVNSADAIKYAMERGLSEKDAKKAAALSYTTLKTKLQKEILKLAVNYKIDAAAAKSMAISFGLTREDASRLYTKVANLSSKTPTSQITYERYETEAAKDSDYNLLKERKRK